MRNNRGFTPLEVLIAMAILIIGIVGAFQLFPRALVQVRMAREQETACNLADSRLGYLRAAGGRMLTYRWRAPQTYMTGAVPTDGTEEIDDVRRQTDFSDLRKDSPAYFEMDQATADARLELYKGYSTTVTRVGALPVAHLHRAVFTVNMPSGNEVRPLRFVTYIAEP